MNESDFFLVVPKSELAAFRFQQDRDYHAKPVRVVPIACKLHDRDMLIVRDDVRGYEYPCMKSKIKQGFALTVKQRESVGL